MNYGRDDMLTSTRRVLQRASMRVRATFRDIMDLLPVSLKRAELCWTGAPVPETKTMVDLCAVEVEALFQKKPDDMQAERLAGLVSTVLSKFGQVRSSVWTTEKASLRARLTMHPTNRQLDWTALDRDLRDAVSERHRRFRVTLTNPRTMIPTGPTAGGLKI